MTIPTNKDGQPLIRAYNWKSLEDRKIDELIGVCKGVLADGYVVVEEARFILDWLTRNRMIAQTWPANVLYPRLTEMLVDGVLDEKEEGELLDLLVKITGGPSIAEPARDMSTALPLDDPPPNIVFAQRAFCFTGKFVFGTRNRCQEAATTKGGVIHLGPNRETSYLVIGLVGSRDWIHSTHGRKIEKAVELRDSGCGIQIVSEEHWATFL